MPYCRSIRTAVAAGSSLIAIGLASPSTIAQDGFTNFSGNLTDIVSSLYGGDGITLRGSEVFSHAAHFTNGSLEQFNNLSLSVRDLSFPVLNPHIGVQFKYDAVLDEFVPTSDAFSASAFAFDAETVGDGEFHLGLAYSVRNFNELSGNPLSDITVDLRHMDLGDDGSDFPCLGGPVGACYAFEKDVIRLSIDLSIREEMFAATGAYGLSDKFDVSFFLPLLRTEMSVSSVATVVENPTRQFSPDSLHLFGGDSDDPVDALQATKTGIGDTVLRLSYSIGEPQEKGWNVNVGADARLPTGQVNNLQGLPRIGVRPRLIASRNIDVIGGIFRPHLNVAYGFNAGLNAEQIFDYAIGGSYAFNWSEAQNTVAVSVDFLGKHVTHNKDQMGDNQFDVSLGLKMRLLQSLNVYYNILLPLNKSGLRPAAQHVFGFQMQF